MGEPSQLRLSPSQFREAVWKRDGGLDRATGRPLSKTDPNWDYLGDVCHLFGRRVRPEWKLDPDRALLLSRSSHILSDGRGNYRLKILDLESGERATDATRRLRFVCYDRDHETVLWQREDP